MIRLTALSLSTLLMATGAQASNFSAQPIADQHVATSSRPPRAYQGDTVLMVQTMDPRKTPDVCKADTEACEGNGVAYMPNPCAYRGDFYADLLCHEAAHAMGWAANHPREAR